MSVKDMLDSLDDEIKIIQSSDFKIEVIETKYVPNYNDSSLTFENFDTKKKKVKTIETCVLYIDIRRSTKLNLQHNPQTMAKLYSSFIRAMIKAAEYYSGKIRNIIGDRVMVIFDSDNCYSNAVNTAVLMNTISTKIINKHFKNNHFSCGIGIDYGKMMVTKCGTIKQGHENSNYKSLVWLGNPANIASKLTDEANKPSTNTTTQGLKVHLHYESIDEWLHLFKTPQEFVENVDFSYISPNMKYKDIHFSSCSASSITKSNYDSTPPILMSEVVYNGYKKENPTTDSIVKRWWSLQSRKIPNYSGKVYGGDVIKIWKD